MDKKIEIIKNESCGDTSRELSIVISGIDISGQDLMSIIGVATGDLSVKDLAVDEAQLEGVVIRNATDEDVKKAIEEAQTPLKEVIPTPKSDVKRHPSYRLPKLKHFICCNKVGITTNDEVKCRTCGKEQSFEEEIILEVICPDCGKKIVAVTNQKNMKFFMCGDCKTHIDVEYDYKTNKVKDLINI